jgi:hypothetical protein
MNDVDILGGESPLSRGRRTSRVQEKPAATEVAAEPVRQSKRVRPGGGVLADRLAVPQYIREAYPDCEFFWENDEKAKIQAREARGWEVVRGVVGNDGKWQPGNQHTNIGSVLSIPVGQGETRSDMQAVLMCLPREWYEDDCRAQEEQNRQIMNSLRRGSNNQDINPDGTYAPRLPNGKYGFSQELGTK